MKNKKIKLLPSISIVTCTYNANLILFKQVLKALRAQDYPGNLIEHIVMDAGSSNGTVELAKKFGCIVFVRPDLKDEEQMRASIGFKKAKGKIILIIQSDNIVVGRDWFRRMVEPFENKKVFCTYTAQYSYKKNMSATTRYGALIGANDPIISPYFLNKIEKTTMIQKRYNKGRIIKETPNYYVVKFNKDNFPPLGDNGQMVLRSVMEKVNKDPREYLHLDTFARMFDLGYDTCGVVKTSIIHVITPDIKRFVIRRIQLKEKFFDDKRNNRRFLIFDSKSKKDRINLIKYIIFSATILPTIIQSARGYLKIRDSAWFLHPIICFLMLGAYAYSEIKWIIRKRFIS
ncbi:MAG: Glycosyl transferase [Microgenomates group bacterium GW2011_GWA2_37_6]|nr:MAG: Glycosyl transferase [Microgenomates group bacterium GW2011_GWA2_37_6]